MLRGMIGLMRSTYSTHNVQRPTSNVQPIPPSKLVTFPFKLEAVPQAKAKVAACDGLGTLDLLGVVVYIFDHAL